MLDSVAFSDFMFESCRIIIYKPQQLPQAGGGEGGREPIPWMLRPGPGGGGLKNRISISK